MNLGTFLKLLLTGIEVPAHLKIRFDILCRKTLKSNYYLAHQSDALENPNDPLWELLAPNTIQNLGPKNSLCLQHEPDLWIHLLSCDIQPTRVVFRFEHKETVIADNWDSGLIVKNLQQLMLEPNHLPWIC